VHLPKYKSYYQTFTYLGLYFTTAPARRSQSPLALATLAIVSALGHERPWHSQQSMHPPLSRFDVARLAPVKKPAPYSYLKKTCLHGRPHREQHIGFYLKPGCRSTWLWTCVLSRHADKHTGIVAGIATAANEAAQ